MQNLIEITGENLLFENIVYADIKNVLLKNNDTNVSDPVEN